MAERRDGTQTAQPGSVADEAALLVDLLSARGWGGPAAGQSDRSSDGSRESSETRSGAHRGECSCGGTTPAACRLCPVCQLISFVQRLSPDTLDTVADVVELAATGLRDLAHAQRDRKDHEGPPSGPPTEGTNPG